MRVDAVLNRRPGNRGIALPVVAIVLVMLGALAFAVLRMLADHRLVAQSAVQRETAFRAAERALASAEHAVAANGLDAMPTGLTAGTCGTGEQAGYCMASVDGRPGWSFASFTLTGPQANTIGTGSGNDAPRYVLELLPDRSPGMLMTMPNEYGGPAPATPAVLVTAAGFGSDTRIMRMLQTMIHLPLAP